MDHIFKDLSSPIGRFATMLLIRRFEEKVEELFSRGLIGGTSHLCIGQEASAVGIVSALAPTDCVVSSHRGHGHFLAKGADPEGLMAELLGKRTGPCRGRGGSQHLCRKDLYFYGTNGITGGGIPVATGIALAAKFRKTGQATICFFGDGASNQGTFHESLNMAAIWSLPILYVCENNLYAMSTPQSASMRVNQVAHRAQSYGIYGFAVDGMDVELVREAGQLGLRRIRSGEGPVLIETLCYRFCGHSKSDRRVYRTREEEKTWEARDPLLLAEEALRKSGVTIDKLEQINAEALARVEQAYQHAVSAPDPAPEEVLVSPYASPKGDF